jgi:hypothetical protein
MIKNQYWFPRMEYLFEKMKGVTMFSNIDLRSGYHQLWIREEEISKTTFKMSFEHYEFVILPFGLTNSPGVFMGFMNGLFHEYLYKIIKVFIDETLIYPQTAKKHD